MEVTWHYIITCQSHASHMAVTWQSHAGRIICHTEQLLGAGCKRRVWTYRTLTSVSHGLTFPRLLIFLIVFASALTCFTDEKSIKALL